ncbi:MAG: type 1 glutamine amidotransferase [Candidatus Marinimicrobia bacterium]|jgi:GMP synthase (glutamine-hydrolysing)|nr:type 1 glutamine amidotransferase [Candidatus Neomarinimicrobiota bacterium]MBT3840173.1 type 1 glutamine amidotransferase [Candidatus Neomarinimicrobiota bacterium]MBT3999167.1 type 1 glutamine amidotransferase [Candidatus Neomarinimicrobiota bacterium]MBT4282603.1 type 1 glutamine amidotransferase [Candidatus Neomarinimicrobiota bacterium]MBT4579699.1 type 1 glutamine amidotransferase [Candidatus Neomarinimicrobiota bacterium]
MKFLILDGYSKESRDQFDGVGMMLAGKLYQKMLHSHLPNAESNILYTSDEGTVLPTLEELKLYDGILWPGCNLTVYHEQDERVQRMITLADLGFESGTPQFGSCWAAQIAVHVAGGKVEKHPKGREMGVARKIYLTEAGKSHPMYNNKPPVFDGFISHDDEITEMPKGAVVLASNDFTSVQAVEVNYKNGSFWAVQYHPEYDLKEMARLIVAREEKLTSEGYFNSHDDMVSYTNTLELIANDPSRKDLRWMAGIDDDLIKSDIRQCEFVNWLSFEVLKNN